jgi:RimK family alpha-L-glutamate ligase
MPRGLSSLERRLSSEDITSLKIEAPIKMIKEGLKHSQKVYKGVYEFTNLVKKDVVLNKSECNLKSILDDYLSSTAYSSQVIIEELPTIEVNEPLFCTAVDNLIRNGLKYNDSDTKFVKITSDEKYVYIQDNGRGITQEDFDHLSKPYTRKEGQKESGTGLGLNICVAILEEHGLPVPKYSLVPDISFLDTALEIVGSKFPLIVKLISGTQGIGVSIVDSYASLKSVYQTIKKLNPDSEILIQEKIDSDFDLRIQVLVKKFNPLKEKSDNRAVLGSMKRQAVEKDFRTNYSLGGTVDKYEITPELEKLAYEASTAVGCHWSGVDIMIDKKTNKPYILEVNSSPGTEGISKVLGEPIVSKLIDYVTDKSNWSYYNIEVGYLENIEIPGIGNMVAKFDTGNSSKSCSIHADKIEEKDGKLIWTTDGDTFVNDIVEYSKTEIGHVIHKRPIIKLDVIFNDVLVKNVKFSPTDRKSKTTPVLINRSFMRRLGIVVNANKAFVVTDEQKEEDKDK